MEKEKSTKLFVRCPRTGRLVLGQEWSRRWGAALFPLAGLASLIWFLVRVVPKPSRAGYPCQRVAAPLASSFVLWLLAVAGSAVAFGRARLQFRRARVVAGAICLVLAVGGIAAAVWTMETPAQAAYAPHAPNQPIGVPRGLAPGRVVWVHDPAVTDWAGPGSETLWYEHVDQAVAEGMMSRALRRYADAAGDEAAWQAIFEHFNGGEGYGAGEKVAIKINLVTTNIRMPVVDENYDPVEWGDVSFDSIANSPQLLHALLDQLVNVAGVAEDDITIGDPTGLFVNFLYEPLHADFPGVHYLDNRGTQGRTRAEYSNVRFHWSTAAANGTTDDFIPTAFAEADYLINFAVLKSHDMGGITVGAKNHYGSLLRNPDGWTRGGNNTGSAPYNGYYDMHASLPVYEGQMGRYRALVDLMGHEELGGKTLLYLVDGIYGGMRYYGAPSRWSMPPFNDDWPSSLFLSMDGVALDSVARDFLEQQWPIDVLLAEGVEDYLHEAALADNPLSGTYYDPEGDGSRLASLGVHEHWNNILDKQYTGNSDPGEGIELVTPFQAERTIHLPLIVR